MRDPNRINKIMLKLKLLWKQEPDMRFCQMICNLTGREDPFFLEDEDFEKILDLALEEFDIDE